MKAILYFLLIFFCISCTPYDSFDLTAGDLTVEEALGFKSDGPYVAVCADSKIYTFGSNIDDDTGSGTNGNNDASINPGETVSYSIRFANYGHEPAIGVSAAISTRDEYITGLQNTSENLGYFDKRSSYGTNSSKSKNIFFTVSPSTPKGHILKFQIVFTDSKSESWSDYFWIIVQ